MTKISSKFLKNYKKYLSCNQESKLLIFFFSFFFFFTILTNLCAVNLFLIMQSPPFISLLNIMVSFT